MKRTVAVALIAVMLACLSVACSRDADVASHNLSAKADNFEIERRIIFYNGITNEYILTIQGLCSIYDEGRQLEVTCKTGPEDYKKHFLGLSDNVTYFVEQLEGAGVSTYRYQVTFKPSTIIPDVENGLN